MSKLLSNSQTSEVSALMMEGRLIDFVIKDGYKLKGLQIATGEGEVYVKLAKHLQINFNWFLPPGTPLQIYGEKKVNHKTGEWKFKAQRVMTLREADNVWTTVSPPPSLTCPLSRTNEDKPKTRKATILVCQKSDCMKRGGKKVCQALEAEVSDRGLENHVTIKGTGCMKSCKAGPNLVMPDKTRYTRIQAAQVPELIDQHFECSKSDKPTEIEIIASTTTASVEKSPQPLGTFS
jgi:(2Fe-2S) ferredoxin